MELGDGLRCATGRGLPMVGRGSGPQGAVTRDRSRFRALLVPTGKCNTLGYATLGLGLAPRISFFLINKAL